ncbi:MAG: LD-carboxypeptidase [Candidatus Moranbacteria bacterium]|nr:LD-carboxypeptidase [Candidatus Moranbacteria bacterium]
MQPRKLRKGDEVRIISPSKSLATKSSSIIKEAEKKLLNMGLKVSYGKNSSECDKFGSSSIKSRLSDLKQALLDENVKIIIPFSGGFNSNQLLKHINYSLIKKNPKIFCGFSDITVLLNSIYAKTDLTTYSGPNFSTFAMKKGFDYTLKSFKEAFFNGKIREIKPAKTWSDDQWWENQKKRNFYKNEGYWVMNKPKSKVSGKILGGNLCSFNLLQGTEFMPNLTDSVLFIEDDNIMGDLFIYEFDRNLQSLIQQKNFSKVKALVVGRFEKKTGITKSILKKILLSKKELQKIPIIANVDFGHTSPQFIFPIGGKVKIDILSSQKAKLYI